MDLNTEDDVNNVVIKPFIWVNRELELNEILYFVYSDVSGGR